MKKEKSLEVVREKETLQRNRIKISSDSLPETTQSRRKWNDVFKALKKILKEKNQYRILYSAKIVSNN